MRAGGTPLPFGTVGPDTRIGPPAPQEAVLAGGLLLLLAGGIVPLLTRPTAGGEDTSSLSILLQGLGCAVATARLARTPGGLRRALDRLDPFVLALITLLLASVVWSVDPTLTARRVGAVCAATAFGLYLASRWSTDEQMWLVLRVLTFAAVTSALLAVLVPAYGLQDGLQWRGVFVTKNVLARLMAVGVVVAVVCASRSPGGSWRRREATTSAVVCGGALLMAGSVFATSTVAGVLVVVAAGAVLQRTTYPLRQAVGSLIAVALVGGVVVLVAFQAQLLDLVGRDANLTGRLPLWSSVWPSILERPWLGYGYGAFWQGWDQPSTEALLRNPWGPPHAHNGVIELALNVGVLGAALWLAALLSCLVRATRQSSGSGGEASVWPIVLVLLTLAFNITEVTAMSNAFFWSLFVGASARLTMQHPPDQPSGASG